MHSFWKHKTVILFHNKSCTTLARLTVDADDTFVLTANIMWIKSKVRNIPVCVFFHIYAGSHTFSNCILMRTAECSKYKLPRIRCTRMNFHSCKTSISLCKLRHISEIKLRINSLSIHVHGNIYDIQVSSSFAVTKKTTFHAVRTSQQTKLALCNTLAPVIVIVQRNNYVFPLRNVLAEIFNLVRKLIRHCALNSCRQIQNYFVCCRTAPFLFYSFTNFKSVINFSCRKRFRRIFKANFSSFAHGKAVLYTADAFNSNLLDFVL